MSNSEICEARPDLSGALFVSFGKSLGTKKRERWADKGAQIITISKNKKPEPMTQVLILF
ncbi:hypothetical protein IO90_06880 [Chryseobacterium sp. FH1]|nr:hypothetical protein IO90_06880 [Chryseobacterium sp. FH1]